MRNASKSRNRIINTPYGTYTLKELNYLVYHKMMSKTHQSKNKYSRKTKHKHNYETEND